jgi:hypothetical protein
LRQKTGAKEEQSPKATEDMVMAAKYYHFDVVGTGEFPTDMLRYDAAFPSDTQSAMVILNPSRWSDADERLEFNRNKRIVKMTCVDRPPTEDRWHSFGWKVTRVY